VRRRWMAAAGVAVAVPALTLATGLSADASPSSSSTTASAATTHAAVVSGGDTTTPIKHVVVIFDENVSFDHYFGTYPKAANPKGEPAFTASTATPSVNGLTSTLLTANPNTDQPTRLSPAQAVTCDMNHGYKAEQQAFDHGLMDQFVQHTDSGDCSAKYTGESYEPGMVMDYYDGNTVTGLWNYAQRFAMSDNSYGTGFGPSTPGALNLVSGQTHGAAVSNGASTGVANGTVIADPNPTLDDCGGGTGTVTMDPANKNIGDLLNAKDVTWGWFQGGFTPTGTVDGKAVCGAKHANVAGSSTADYSSHHNPFAYYASTANPHHLAPTSAAMIGKTDQANHQYDLSSFWTSVKGSTMPAVSFLKAPAYQDGHAGYSDPLDEQHFVTDTVNKLMDTPDWKSTAVVLAYDDSDGWYDHQMSPIVEHSADPAQDALSADGSCGTPRTADTAKPSVNSDAYSDRCGYGPRLPLLVISPWAKRNYVDHTLTDQTSILKFVEDNWSTGQIGDDSFDAIAGPLTGMFDFSERTSGILKLDPTTGEPTNR